MTNLYLENLEKFFKKLMETLKEIFFSVEKFNKNFKIDM